MPVKKEKSTQSVKDLALLGINYANNKKEIKHLEAECTKMRKPLESYLEEEGHVLESGSKLAILPYVDVEVHLKKTLRTGKVLLPEAMEVLEKMVSLNVLRMYLLFEKMLSRLFIMRVR